MSKDNRTIEILQKNLDEDMAWRIKELSILKNKIPPQKGTEQDVLIRAGITTLYAHWEGFIKYAHFICLFRLVIFSLLKMKAT